METQNAIIETSDPLLNAGVQNFILTEQYKNLEEEKRASQKRTREWKQQSDKRAELHAATTLNLVEINMNNAASKAYKDQLGEETSVKRLKNTNSEFTNDPKYVQLAPVSPQQLPPQYVRHEPAQQAQPPPCAHQPSVHYVTVPQVFQETTPTHASAVQQLAPTVPEEPVDLDRKCCIL